MMETERERLPAWLGWTRLGVGVAQGLALFALQNWGAPLGASLQGAVTLAVILPPLVLVVGLGAIRPITLAIWTVAAALLCVWLGWHDASRYAEGQRQPWETSWIWMVAVAMLFVGHHLVAAGDEARKPIAPYARYFDLGWRTGAQLLLALLFVGAFWLVLYLGGAMFNVIGIKALNDLIAKPWFHWPASAAVFALAIHLTDLRSGFVRGARALGLILLSWLLPAMAALAIAFFVALPFTGLEPLWATRSATLILLGAAATLVVLINAAYQDGANPPGLILRSSARVAAIIITPLAALAAYALYLRVAQYGLTPERIYAGAILLIGLCYAVPYFISAFARQWMKPIEIGNIVGAFVVLAMGLALFTPIADPARLSVADQMNRLRKGLVSAESFDVGFLRFQGARYGVEALERLRADQSNDAARTLARRAELAAAADNPWTWETQQPVRFNIRMHPEGTAVPEGFGDPPTVGSVPYVCREARCDGFLLDLSGDGKDELLLADEYQILIFAHDPAAGWEVFGRVQADIDDAMRAALARGELRTAPARVPDLVIGDRQVSVADTYFMERAARAAVAEPVEVE